MKETELCPVQLIKLSALDQPRSEAFELWGSIHGDATLVWLWSLFGNMVWSYLLVGPNSWETTLS